MAYRIEGLDPARFQQLFGLGEDELAKRGAVRMRVTDKPGFPCRISLDDAEVGAAVLLVNHVSHDVANAYRSSHAIFVTEGLARAATYIDEIPPALDRRILSLRAFDSAGMMIDAALVQPGEAGAAVRRMLGNTEVVSVHAHNAMRGCFAAAIERN